MSTPRAKEKLEHHFLWSVSALSFQPLLIVNTQAQPFPGGDRACWDSPGLCPESAPLDNPSRSHCSWSSVFLQPAPISPPSTHIQPLQYHIQSQSCHSALRGLNLGSSNSFPAPTFTTAQQPFMLCFLALQRRKSSYGDIRSKDPQELMSVVLWSPVIWVFYLWWCLSCTRHLRMHREWEKKILVASEVTLVTTHSRKNTPEAFRFSYWLGFECQHLQEKHMWFPSLYPLFWYLLGVELWNYWNM